MRVARRITEALLGLALFLGTTAHAFFDTPSVTPTGPYADETVSIIIRHGICDSIFDGVPGFPQISRTGNAIRIVYYGVHYEPGDELCVFGVGTVATSVGSFAPGDYLLTADLAYLDPTTSAPTILPIGSVSFSVAPSAQTISVPAAGYGALASLAAVVMVIALSTIRLNASKPSLSSRS